MKKIILISSVLFTLGFSSPAYDGNIEFEQRDGTIFTGHLNGDEYFSWIEDKQGHIILYNKSSKNYEYALLKRINKNLELIPSGSKVKLSSDKFQKTNISIPNINKSELSKIWQRKKKKNMQKNSEFLKDQKKLTTSVEKTNTSVENEFSAPPTKNVGSIDKNGNGIAITSNKE